MRSGRLGERVGPVHGEEAEEVRQAFNRMMDELARTHRRLIQTSALAHVGELGSSVVHEMRNPLSSIKINLRALEAKAADDPVDSELTAIALTQVERLEKMLEELLQFARPVEVDPRRVAMEDVFANALGEVMESAREMSLFQRPGARYATARGAVLDARACLHIPTATRSLCQVLSYGE